MAPAQSLEIGQKIRFAWFQRLGLRQDRLAISSQQRPEGV
jgi:hypothetical protein